MLININSKQSHAKLYQDLNLSDLICLFVILFSIIAILGMPLGVPEASASELHPLNRASGISCLANRTFAASRDLLTQTPRISLQELASLRSIDDVAVSPDGKIAAFEIVIPDPIANKTETKWVAIALDGSFAKCFGTNGPPLYERLIGRHISKQPRWSIDGRYFFAIGAGGNGNELWRFDMSGEARAVKMTEGVESFEMTDANLLRVTISDAQVLRQRDATQAAVSGVFYDGKQSYIGMNPFDPGQRLGPASGLTSASPSRRTVFINPASLKIESHITVQNTPPGFEIKLEDKFSTPSLRLRRLARKGPGETSAALSGWHETIPAWWVGRNGAVLFQANDDRTSSLWVSEGNNLKQIWTTQSDEILSGCSIAENHLVGVCSIEGPTSAPILISIDLISGTSKKLYDPNPEFARKASEYKIRFISDINQYGDKSSAYIVTLGESREPRPAIVTTYNARGFLRGGTGDEMPILPMAAEGFAVIAWNKDFYPHSPTSEKGGGTDAVADFMFPKISATAGISDIVNSLIADRSVDRSALGIYGLSFGSEVVHHALKDTNLFSAGSATTAYAWNPTWYYLNSAAGRQLDKFGPPWDDVRWDALDVHQDDVRVPLLIQAKGYEYLASIPSMVKLAAWGNPVEMYIIADEGHGLIQPAHRLAVYRRNLQWFNFWLRHVEDTDPLYTPQYDRWSAMSRLTKSPDSRPR